jgi:hypothetical protein
MPVHQLCRASLIFAQDKTEEITRLGDAIHIYPLSYTRQQSGLKQGKEN